MAAFISWVDCSSEEREKMRQAVALFGEKETRDELGIGGIRDAIADALFPGMSTIQTRLRYALFIPWIYQSLEQRQGASSRNVQRLARDSEVSLIGHLVEATNEKGVIGRDSGRELQRLPSSVYWRALQRWGIHLRSGRQEEYHRLWDRLRESYSSQPEPDDRGVLPSTEPTWHADLPKPPEDFPKQADFELRLEDATFLRERFIQSCSGSFLANAALLLAPEGLVGHVDLDAESPWLAFPDAVRHIHPEVANTLSIAEKFAQLMYGAARVYNLALARRLLEQTGVDSKGWVSKHQSQLEEWKEESQRLNLVDWPLEELWSFLALRTTISSRLRSFITDWQSILRSELQDIENSDRAFSLVEQRERQLKGSQSRFVNDGALGRWSGEAGTGLLDYRWGTASQCLKDLQLGLSKGGEIAQSK